MWQITQEYNVTRGDNLLNKGPYFGIEKQRSCARASQRTTIISASARFINRARSGYTFNIRHAMLVPTRASALGLYRQSCTDSVDRSDVNQTFLGWVRTTITLIYCCFWTVLALNQKIWSQSDNFKIFDNLLSRNVYKSARSDFLSALNSRKNNPRKISTRAKKRKHSHS